MIMFGVLLFVVGLLANIAILKTLGLVLLVIGAALFLLGRAGHAVGGRSHYW